MFSPSSPLSMRVMGVEATAFESPVIVTTDISVAVKFVSVAIVTVIVFNCPARGLLWPIFFVVKDGGCCESCRVSARTVEHHKPDINIRNIM
jgi:hypothetical protein